MKRGDIYWIAPAKATGHEQTGQRPGVIIQNDKGNLHSGTTIIAYITTKDKKASQPTHVDSRAGCIMLEQIYTIDKSRVENKVGELSAAELGRLNVALGVSVALGAPTTLSDMLQSHQDMLQDQIQNIEAQELELMAQKDRLNTELSDLKVLVSLREAGATAPIALAPEPEPGPEPEPPVVIKIRAESRRGISKQVLGVIRERGTCKFADIAAALSA